MPPTTTNPTIARLAALCDESGLKQDEIAEGAGMMQQALSRLLRGEIDPSISRVAMAIGYKLVFVDVGSGPESDAP